MVLLSGRITKIVIFLIYGVLGSLIILSEKLRNTKIQLFQAKAFLDCDVDNDNDENTCVSSYTLDRSIEIPLQVFVACAYIISSLSYFLMIVVHVNHELSIFKYVDNILSNTIFMFTFALIGGIQEVKFLAILTTCIFTLELLYAYHDFNLDTSITGKLFITIWILQIVIWTTIIVSTALYIVNAYPIPWFIPTYVYIGLTFNIMIRIFHLRFYYHIIPKKLGYNRVETYKTIQQEQPFYIDWSESWTNTMFLLQRISIGMILHFGLNQYKISYI